MRTLVFSLVKSHDGAVGYVQRYVCVLSMTYTVHKFCQLTSAPGFGPLCIHQSHYEILIAKLKFPFNFVAESKKKYFKF